MLSDEQWQKIADKTGCFITGGLKEAIEAEVRKQDTALIRQLVDALEDAARYRWLASHCRSTSEHWGGRWSIVVEGPAPKSRDSEDDFDAAIDAAMAANGGNK